MMKLKFFIFPIFILMSSVSLVNYYKGSSSLTSRNYKKSSLLPEDSLLNQLKAVDMKPFIGKDVGLFLNQSIIDSYKEYAFATEPVGRLSYTSFIYSRDVVIEIVINEYKYLKQFSNKRQWDFETFKKEKIAKIRLLYKGKVLALVESVN